MNTSFSLQPHVKALIIDDETDTCYILSSILKQRNIQSKFAGSLAEAGELLTTAGDFSIIFLDNHLPDGYGISLVQQLKQKNPLAHLVMISAHDAGSDKEKAKGGGVDQFIGKPFSKDVILKTIDTFQETKKGK